MPQGRFLNKVLGVFKFLSFFVGSCLQSFIVGSHLPNATQGPSLPSFAQRPSLLSFAQGPNFLRPFMDSPGLMVFRQSSLWVLPLALLASKTSTPKLVPASP
ncbi:hypothetical protein ATANTOWER_025603 [Ataeniobius toweri]|uniref:Secreted protein n=1 Tax=Ataeniobius toweri TaxID=208326 RepID=A0ABU7BUP0_9TELE|nr:hypothetical protein [Ataeniobius toweri]